MANIQILLVEDDKSLALEIEIMIEELGYNFLGCYNNSEDAVAAIDLHRPDLVIMDINIQGEKDGIEVAHQIAEKKLPLIFITALKSKNHFDRAKSIAPAAYLVKPFQLLTLQNTIELAVMNIPQVDEMDKQTTWTDTISPQGAIFIKMNKTLHKVYAHDICWMEVSGNYSYFFTKEKKYILKMSLKSLLKHAVLQNHFIRVHKNYVVQLKFIDKLNISDNTLKINDTSIPIGRRFKKDLLEQIQPL